MLKGFSMGKTRLMVAGALLATLTLTACNAKESGTATPAGASSSDTKQGSTGFDSLKSLAAAVKDKSTNAKSAHVTMTGSAGGQTIDGEGDFSFAGADTAMQMTMSTPGGDMTMVFVDKAIYMKMPTELTPGKPWVKFSAGGDDPLSQMLGDSLDSMTGADPREALAKMVDAGEVTKTEKAELNGEQTTHYSITVDVAKLTAESGYDEETRKQMQAAGIKELPMEVWVNGDDLPVRMITSVPVEGAGEVKMQADYTDWGKGVTIEAPDPSQVGTLGG
ncbi:putative lipoprotein precursor [Actinokineospora spheciospongiae]|uniref:Putative lipoprotein n=1 Tax=Actinokineospora spheciospongiae TaxID=909613 RepID=W7IBM1_9PSEU|nr:hypothetical protein [Actinokineospora spheciospongiae]EWC58185.1 putative lipoprotein precursor [Actinokineospora spheciospongiae]